MYVPDLMQFLLLSIFLISPRGNPILQSGPDRYYRHRINKQGVTRWFCEHSKVGCKAAVFTIDETVLIYKNSHNHERGRLCTVRTNKEGTSDFV